MSDPPQVEAKHDCDEKGDDIVWSFRHPTGRLPQPRNVHSAVNIDNRMFVFGGRITKATDANDVRVFDPITNKWTFNIWVKNGEAPTARRGHSAVEIDGKMYVFGGYEDKEKKQTTNDVWEFEPNRNEWVKLEVSGTPPKSCHDHSATVIDGKMYVFGGWLQDSSRSNSMSIFDPSSLTWIGPVETTGENPSPRYGHSAVQIDGFLYVFGGYCSFDDFFNDLHIFNPSANQWSGPVSCTGDIPEPREGHVAFVVDKKMFIHGGSGSKSKWRSDMFVFDSEEFVWRKIAAKNSPVLAGHSAVVIGGDVLLFGGCKGKARKSDVTVLSISSQEFQTEGFTPVRIESENLNPESSTSSDVICITEESKYNPGCEWDLRRPRGRIPEPRSFHSAVILDSKMIIFGGESDDNIPLNDVRVYNPVTDRWTFDIWVEGKKPAKRQNHSAVVMNDEMYVSGGLSDFDDIALCGSDIWKFSQKANRWTKVVVQGTPPDSCAGHAAVVVKNKMFTFGGWLGGTKCSNDLSIFDPDTSTWITPVNTIGPKPSPRACHSIVEIGDILYVFGGRQEKQFFCDVFIFNPSLNQWYGPVYCTGVIPTPRSGHVAFVVDEKLYIQGGLNEEKQELSDMFVFDPKEFTWQKVEIEKSPALGGHSAVVIDGKVMIFGGQLEENNLNDIRSLTFAA